jgi:uncharacterized protein DUF4118
MVQTIWFPPLARNPQSGVSSRPEIPLGETVARPEYWLRLNPWSLPPFCIALVGLALAVALRMALASCGLPLYFGTFFPVILAISLIAGVPAGVFTALSAVVIVWWAFIPPVFEFSPLERNDIDRFQLFLLAISVVIWFSHLCRLIAQMRTEQSA